MTPGGEATVVVELTPPGRAAVAVILVAGPDAARAVGKCFAPRSGHPFSEVPLGQIVLGRWGGADGEELIVCRRDEARIEIHCHGGTAAVEAVVTRLVVEGCKQITWQEWIGRSSVDSIRAAAQRALANAVTERTAAILLDQFNGALSESIRGIIAQVSEADWNPAGKLVDDLLNRRELGLHLTEPWRVVVFGAPNVGKSSLINALTGYERAIVSPMPGTTRDVVTVTTAIDGWPVQLADTAGIRTAQDEIESAGIEIATATVTAADLVIVVRDAEKLSDKSIEDEAIFVPATIALSRIIHAINKIDLIPVADGSDLQTGLANLQPEIGTPQFVSALTGEGIDRLVAAIGRSLAPRSLPAGSAVPFTVEQINRLEAAGDAISRRDAPAAIASLQAMLAS